MTAYPAYPEASVVMKIGSFRSKGLRAAAEQMASRNVVNVLVRTNIHVKEWLLLRIVRGLGMFETFSKKIFCSSGKVTEMTELQLSCFE